MSREGPGDGDGNGNGNGGHYLPARLGPHRLGQQDDELVWPVT